MSREIPYMQFYAGDWLNDVAVGKCSPSTRGIWFDLICSMHQIDRSGVISGTLIELSRVARCQAVEMDAAIKEIQKNNVADVTFRNDNVTLINRRMRLEHKQRNDNKLKVNKHRDKARCNQDVTDLLPDCNGNVPGDTRAVQSQSQSHIKEKITKEISGKLEGAKPLTTSPEIILAAERIASKHPRLTKPFRTQAEIIAAINRSFDKGFTAEQAIEYLEKRTEFYAKAVSGWPKEDRQYIVNSENWFKDGCYNEDCRTWIKDGGNTDDDGGVNDFVH